MVLFLFARVRRLCQKTGYGSESPDLLEGFVPVMIGHFFFFVLSLMRTLLWITGCALALQIGFAGAVFAQEKTDLERRGLFSRLLHRDAQSKLPPPTYNDKVHDVYMDRETDTVSAHVKEQPEGAASRENDPVQRYPEIPGYLSIKNSSQKDIEALIEKIYTAYEARIDRMDPPDLRRARLLAMGGVPTGYPTSWKSHVASPLWHNQQTTAQSVEDVYRRALEHSNQIKVYRDLPLIRETGMQEADGEFDITTYIDARMNRRNEPIGSTLTTGNSARRFIEQGDYIEGGFRKKIATGGEVSLSNRFSTLTNNSTFLTPKNQGSSEFVLSIVQPLLEGGGYHYNQSRIKLAKFDASMASAEFVRQLQSHLVEVNRAYWSLYYARAYYLLNDNLVSDTNGILNQLEQRSDLDALQSEVLRARSSLAMRKSVLNRAEMAVRNSEERLRALINDPDQDIGSNVEMIPCTPPIMTRFIDDVRTVATDALRNRPEIQAGFDELRAAIVRRDAQKNQKWPTLNLVAELMLSDIEPRDGVGNAFEDQFGDGTGYMIGFQFEQPWDNDVDRARLLRSEIELRQQANKLRATIDLVLLESLISYRELMTSYRDMQGRYAALQASREELRQLKDRLEVDTEDEGGRTTASQLQLILDSMDRNQTAEEMFLDAVVSYNASFASLQQARGTFLKTQNVDIERVRDTDDTHPSEDVERLQISKPTQPGSKGGKSYDIPTGSPSTDPIPEVPGLTMEELIDSNVTPEVAVAPAQKRSRGLFGKKKSPEPAAAAAPAPQPASYPEPSFVEADADAGLFATEPSSSSGSDFVSFDFSEPAEAPVEPADMTPSAAVIPISASIEPSEPAPAPEASARKISTVVEQATYERKVEITPSASARPVSR